MKRLSPSKSAATTDDSNELLVLNIGGTLHTTTRHVLTGSVDYFPDSVLARMFSDSGDSDLVKKDADGHYFIDADPQVFRHILNVLRRPKLVEDVPADMSPAAWCCELDYWGLVKEDDVAGTTTFNGRNNVKTLTTTKDDPGTKLYEESTLEEIGKAITKEIMDNELVAVRTLLEKSGYFYTNGKTRGLHSIYVPVGRYKLPWGTDIGLYLKENQKSVAALLEAMLHQRAINVHDCKVQKESIEYEFDGQPYSTRTQPTVTVALNFSQLDTLQNKL
jgi:hypothetical protein